MQNGLYRVQFGTPLGTGAGVVTLRDGQIRGGDSMMYYVGTYSESGGTMTAQVASKTHTRGPGMESVFGIDPVTITMQGTASDTSAQLNGTAKEAPGVGFQVTLNKLADL